jgi:serine phosphatase RsbU (regulator of sigma subunit)
MTSMSTPDPVAPGTVATRSPASEPVAVEVVDPAPPRLPAEPSTQEILLVEDDDGDALLVEALLEEAFDGAVEVYRASTLAQAVQWVARRPRRPGWCALVDLNLPDAEGLEIVDALRKVAPNDPVVVLTGLIDESRGLEAVGAGAQDYLVKGRVDAERLRRAIRYAIQRCMTDEGARLLLQEQILREENARLERGLLPSPVLERHADLRWASRYRPGSDRLRLGGDFFDVVEADGAVHLLVGDVCGHGPDEAALGVVMRVAWRALTRAGLGPAAVMEQLNDLMWVEAVLPGQFTTAISVRLLAPDRLGVVMAGHPAPVVLGAEGARCLDDVAPGPPLGVQHEQRWTESEVEVPDAGWLLLYTDGLIEARAAPGSTTRLGAETLLSIIDEVWAEGARGTEMLGRLLAEVERRQDGTTEDDIAMLAVDLGTVDLPGRP